MSGKSIDLKELKAIVDWVNVTEDIREFSLRYGDVELFISRNLHLSDSQRPLPVAASAPAVPAPAVTSPAVAAGEPPPPVAASAPTDGDLAADEVLIKSPMVGTFYSAPKPGQPDFVGVGDKVAADTVLCIVEVMKLMNNIEAQIEGTVARILVRNEQAVQYGQPLMVIKCN